MQMDKTWKESPPNVSYKAFDSLISNLHDYLPTRLDNSYLSGNFSMSTGTRLMSALSFLNLIDGGNRPKERLKLLVAATIKEDRSKQMRIIANEAYAFVLKEPVDLQHATYAEMENLFHDYGVKSDLFPKCLKFFIEFAKNADIALSPQLTKKHPEPRVRSITSSQTKKINKLFKAHREASWEECRWCFAIDLQSVKAKEIAKYNFPDATILRMKCDRCGGEYSYYFRVRGEDYVKERMIALHPDIQGHITDDMICTINHRL